jgi:hypothetical protein
METKTFADANTEFESTEPPSKRLRSSSEHAGHLIALKNVIEVDGKSCSHEVAWPPGKEEDNIQYTTYNLFWQKDDKPSQIRLLQNILLYPLVYFLIIN